MNIVDLVFTPEKRSSIALISDAGCLTFGELENAVEHAVCVLREVGLPTPAPGRVPRIALACPNGPEHVIFALAILKLGGCLVPIAGELAAPEREEVVRTVGVDATILCDTQPWPERTAADPGKRLPGLDATLYLGRTSDHPLAFQEADLAALNPAFIRFSSGSTGKSKGVVLSHETLLERIELANRRLGIGAGDRVIWILSMAHHFAVSIMLYLLKGAVTVIVKSHLAEDILSAGRAWNGTVLYGSPFHHSLLAAEPSGRSWPTLRLAVSTAAPLPAATAEAFEARYGLALSQALGVIEAGLPLLNTTSAHEKPTAIGRPLDDLAVELRDLDTDLPLTGCAVGELLLRCPGMFDAYLDPWQPRETLQEPGGWFRTGDLAQRDADGDLYLVGRVKTVINVAGMKCFPEEIEAVLQQHPGVRAVRVFGRENRRFGAVPVAEIVPENEPPTAPQLVAFCRASLASYKVPAEFRFVPDLLRTASGKIRR